MKTITNRQDFGTKVNFGEYPVIKIDMSQKPFMDTIYHGDKVRVDFGHYRSGHRNLGCGELIYNIKDNTYEIASYGICLTKDFCYEDAMEQVEYSQAPIINEGDKVVIVLYNSKEKDIKVYLATAKDKREFCSTMLVFE